MNIPSISSVFGIGIAIVAAVWCHFEQPSQGAHPETNTSRHAMRKPVPKEGRVGESEGRAARAHSERGLKPLIAGLRAASGTKQKAAFCDELVRLGTDASIQAWSDAVHAETDEITRLHMVAALDVLDSDVGLELVTSVIEFATDEIVLEAVNLTISRSADADTVAHLVEIATDAELNPGQQQRALTALAGIENSAATGGLAHAVMHSSPEVRRAAASSLAKISTPEAAGALLACLAALPAEALIERSVLRHHLAEMPVVAADGDWKNG